MTYEPKLRRSRGVTLSGIARPSTPKTVGAMGVAAAMMFLAGCSTVPDDGVVVEGADGENYVLPDGAERPTYTSKEDCLADVNEQIQLLEQQGEQLEGDAESLCESSSSYGTHYSSALWLGPVLFASSRWNSTRVSSWAPVTSGGFAAPGSSAHSDVAQKAPAGATVGSRAPLKSGFGATGKSGFGSTVKGGGGSGSSTGG
ncbi:hypothetical protein [Pseudoclavibacter sp. AY1H1]|uniref:hypothetical protein n=1 Tax=Pseudoclavibacter sp. AY1H1 TaxID=2080584 RepID=UPI000CE8F820|nr:hypothetical protein [Pseudoclavibacter sp. AY1H1]PPF39924.1 hypothetical protein C5E05_01550 [Pseudoclavibacter sp. AY1H1]